MSKILNAIFGTPQKSPEEQAKEWSRQLNAEARKVDGQIRKIQMAEKKAVLSAKQAAKKGDMVAVRMLAKEIINSRKAVKRMYTAKAQMNSIGMQLKQQMSQLKLAGAMSKSTEVMAHMNQLMRVQDIQQTMQAMSKEMMKAGLIDEMVGDTLDSALDDVEEEELDEEVGKVVEEVMQAKMSGAHVGVGKLPAKQEEAAQEEVEEPDQEEEDLMAKFKALRSGAA